MVAEVGAVSQAGLGADAVTALVRHVPGRPGSDQQLPE